VEAMPKGVLSVRRRWGGELDRKGAGHGQAAGGRVPAHGAYSARHACTVG
jgi:hypothetical protein